MAEKSEDFARTDIDRLLAAAGWVVRPFSEASPTLRAVCAKIRAKMPTIAFTQGWRAMPRIFDNIELEHLPVLRATLSKPIIDVIDCVLARHYGFA